MAAQKLLQNPVLYESREHAPHFRPACVQHRSHHSNYAKNVSTRGGTIVINAFLNDAMLMLHTDRTNGNHSSVFNPIPLTSGDGGDLGYYRAEIVTLGLCMVSVSRGLPGRVPPIRRERVQTKRFGT